MAGTTASKLDYLNSTKDVLRNNLIIKGMDVVSETPFREMAEMVQNLQVEVEEYATVAFTGGSSYNPDTGYAYLSENGFLSGKGVSSSIKVRVGTIAVFWYKTRNGKEISFALEGELTSLYKIYEKDNRNSIGITVAIVVVNGDGIISNTIIF